MGQQKDLWAEWDRYEIRRGLSILVNSNRLIQCWGDIQQVKNG